MARIGLFGGTFNPIHVGHLMIAAEARQALALDEVLFIPSGDSYLKDPAEIAPRAARLEMTRLAVATLQGFGVSDGGFAARGRPIRATPWRSSPPLARGTSCSSSSARTAFSRSRPGATRRRSFAWRR